MFLQTDLTTRRKFLERSMLGFGSAFVLPSLLASCTDHRIPGPDGPLITPPTLGGNNDVDWNDDAKLIISALIGTVPGVGGILSAMVKIFWPFPGSTVWDQIKDQVEALIDLKITEEVYSLVEDALGSLTPTPTGLISYINTYQLELTNGTPTSILNAWNNAVGAFKGAQKYFQDSNNQVPLLPLFAQFANMYLALLGDGVRFGQSWGRTVAEHNNIDVPTLTNAVTAFVSYATDTYNDYLKHLQDNTKPDYDKNEPFLSTNTFTRQMTLWVLNYMDTWPYYDVTKYPNGAVNPGGTRINLFTREIYTDPYGNTYVAYGDPHPISLPQPATQLPTNITVWGGSRIDAVQLTYPAGGGPGGITPTAKMGNQKGDSIQGSFALSPQNPFIQFEVTYDYYQSGDPAQAIDTMQFLYNDGTATQKMGTKEGQFDSDAVGYLYMALSSIYIQGMTFGLDNSANCIVFGFLYWTPPAAILRTLANIYITSPKEPSVADFANAYPDLGLSANSITDDLKAARKAYWEYIKAHAKK